MDNTVATVNGEEKEMDVPARMINDRIMILLHFNGNILQMGVVEMGWGSGALLGGLVPVSYTHLDVYKRQHEIPTFCRLEIVQRYIFNLTLVSV